MSHDEKYISWHTPWLIPRVWEPRCSFKLMTSTGSMSSVPGTQLIYKTIISYYFILYDIILAFIALISKNSIICKSILLVPCQLRSALGTEMIHLSWEGQSQELCVYYVIRNTALFIGHPRASVRLPSVAWHGPPECSYYPSQSTESTQDSHISTTEQLNR